MLNGINPILTGDLLKVLSDMGHGDEIVVADGNFAATSNSKRYPPIRVSSDDTIAVVRAILDVLPIDQNWRRSRPLAYIGRDNSGTPHNAVQEQFVELAKELVRSRDLGGGRTDPGVKLLHALEFRDRAREAYAIVATTDPRHYACFILRKGVLPDPTAQDDS